jgi:hypothetical protein
MFSKAFSEYSQKSGLGLKITALWDIMPYSLVVVDRRFRGVYTLHHREETDDCLT